MAIKDKFTALVVFPAKYISVLKIVMPNTAVSVRYRMCFFTILKLLIVLFIANGAKTIHATVQRQKANPTGGM